MAKIEAKKESVLKLRFTEHGGQKWKLWREFYADLIESFGPKGFYIDLGHQSQGLIWLSRGTAEEEIKKADIIEIAQKHKIEIEFEEEKEKKEEKWRPVDEIAIELLKGDITVDFFTIAKLYERGGRAPKQGIPDLLERFKAALEHTGGHLNETIEKAIANLEEQQEE